MTMRKYRPTERDREIVLRMAAVPNISRDNIAFCITNERTGKAIDRHTLEKHFAKELELATSHMQNLVMKSFVEMIAERSWPAVKMGLANYCSVKDDSGEAVANANVQVNLGRAEREGIQVRFVAPSVKYDSEGNPVNTLPPPDMNGPRPMNQSEHTDQRYPSRIDGAASESNPSPPKQKSHVPPPAPEPEVAVPGTWTPKSAREERSNREGWVAANPRSSIFEKQPFNPNRPSRGGKFT